jgi:hypothetical protein
LAGANQPFHSITDLDGAWDAMKVGVIDTRSGLSASDRAMFKKEGLFAVRQTVERAHLFPLVGNLLQQFRGAGPEATLVGRRSKEEMAIGEWRDVRRQVEIIVAPYYRRRRELSYFAIKSKAIFGTEKAGTHGVVTARVAPW